MPTTDAAPELLSQRTGNLVSAVLRQLHARGPDKLIVTCGLLIACLSTGCAGKDAGKGAAILRLGIALGKPLPFGEVLQNSNKLAPEELKMQLRAVRSAPGTSDLTGKEAAYVLGRVLEKSGSNEDLKEALPLFEEASKIPALWERSHWHRSECAATLGEEKVVRQALSAIEEKAQDSETKANAAYGLAQSYLRANEKEKGRDTFVDLRKRFPTSNFALGSGYYLAEMMVDDADKQELALSLFRDYLRTSPDGHFARNILSRLAALKNYSPTAADRGLFGAVHFVHGEWQEALDDWNKAGATNRWYERASCLMQLGRTNEAKQALMAGIKTHPSDKALPSAARTLSELASRDEAVSLWKTILSLSPKYGYLALWNLAIRSSSPQSVSYFQELLKKYPSSEFAPEASWWVFWDQVKQGKSRPALAQAVAAEKRYPNTRSAPRFAFWIGKLHERLKENDAAKVAYARAASDYSSSYYGWRAAARRKALSGGKDDGWATNPARKDPGASWTCPEPPALMSYEQIEKTTNATVAYLIKLHQWEESLELLTPSSSASVRSFLLSVVNLPLDAINAASASLSGKPDGGAQWRLAYPLLYARTISEASSERGIDPLLVHALIREESRYNPQAVSRSNAIGLMQLLPGTAYGIAKRIGLNLSSNDDIYKPENNLKLGINYLAYVIKRNQPAGAQQAAAMLGVASYNGGPNAAQFWAARMKQQGSNDWDAFVENIPLKETREYVRKVFGSFWNYQAIYSPDKPRS